MTDAGLREIVSAIQTWGTCVCVMILGTNIGLCCVVAALNKKK